MNWGRPFRLVSPLVDCSSLDTTPAQIECGWTFSSVLTKSGSVLVFWPFGGEAHDVYTAKMEQLDRDRTALAHPIGGLIPCHTWELGNDPMVLPPLPALPELTGTGLDEETLGQDTTLIKIAAMDNSIVGLTNKGHVVKIDLSIEIVTGFSWKYVSLFGSARHAG